MAKTITRKSNIRLNGYDYSQPNHYFITTCTENKQEWFGKIQNDKMKLNSFGQICLHHLNRIHNHSKNIGIDIFVIMPNHIHAIIKINQNDKLFDNGQALGLSLHNHNDNDNQKSNKTLSKIICDFKSFCSREINKTMPNSKKFKWQRSFHDHIIRNDRSLQTIREYIVNNPATWAEDEENINRITKKSS